MTTETKIITILKTVAIALAAGIISGALIGLASPVAGVLVGFTIAAVVGLTSFACFTSAYDPVECLKDHTNKCLSKIKQKVNEFIH